MMVHSTLRRVHMRTRARFSLPLLSLALMLTACGSAQSPPSGGAADRDALVGAWRSKIVFQGGALAGMKDLEFLHAYNAGGTMTESSNYDEAPNSSPPAYGIWKQVAPRTFQTKYVYYTTRKSQPSDGPPNTDWWPAGHGVLTETITLSGDGHSYASTIKLVIYDSAGTVTAGGGEGRGVGTRIEF